MQPRYQQKDAVLELMCDDAMDLSQPSTSGIVTPAEFLKASFKCLEAGYQMRLEELHAVKQFSSTVCGFPDESMWKRDDKRTAFYTALLSYTILMPTFRHTTHSNPDSTILGTNYKNIPCFLLTLMNLKHNLSNFNFGFRFCIHVTTFGQIITNWLQPVDIQLTEVEVKVPSLHCSSTFKTPALTTTPEVQFRCYCDTGDRHPCVMLCVLCA